MAKKKRTLSKQARQGVLDQMTSPLDEWGWESMIRLHPVHAAKIREAVDAGVEDDWLAEHFSARGYTEDMLLWYEQCVRHLVAERDKTED